MPTNQVFGIFVLLSLIYIGLTFGIPPDEASLTKYQLSAGEVKALQLTFVVPIIAIWMTGFYAYAKFRNYANAISESTDGVAWKEIVKGLLVLALWLPSTSIISSITSYLWHRNPELTPSMIITANYLNLLIVLVAFVFLYRGTITLVRNLGLPPLSFVIKSGSEAVLVIASGLFAYLALSSPYKSVPPSETVAAAYYLPDWLLILTIIIPYVFIFYLGFRVVQNLYLYRLNVSGTLYKSALSYLAGGLGVVVITLMVLRYLASLSSVFTDATIKGILTILYLLIFIIAVGYILIARGAKKLQRLEEV